MARVDGCEGRGLVGRSESLRGVAASEAMMEVGDKEAEAIDALLAKVSVLNRELEAACATSAQLIRNLKAI